MDGAVIILIGEGKSGKTTLALDFCDNIAMMEMFNHKAPKYHKAILVTPQESNPRFVMPPPHGEFDFIVDHGQSFKDAYKRASGHLRIIVNEERADLFKRLEDYPIVLLDELTLLISENESEKAFKKFCRNVRSREQTIIITTHRLLDDLPPVVRGELCRKLIQVGPVRDRQKQRVLYNHGNIAGAIGFESFCQSMERLEPYNYQRKNKNGWYIVKDS